MFAHFDLQRLREQPEPGLPTSNKFAIFKRQFWRALMLRRQGLLDSGEAREGLPTRLQRRTHWMEQRKATAVLREDLPLVDPQRLLDTLQLDRLEHGVTLLKPVRRLDPESLPPEVQTQMENRERQFFLRNIPRIEREDAQEIEFGRETVERASIGETFDLDKLEAERVIPWFAEFNADFVARYRRGVHEIFFEEDWTRRFGHEIKERILGPIWKYQPDAAEPSGEPAQTT